MRFLLPGTSARSVGERHVCQRKVGTFILFEVGGAKAVGTTRAADTSILAGGKLRNRQITAICSPPASVRRRGLAVRIKSVLRLRSASKVEGQGYKSLRVYGENHFGLAAAVAR